MGDHAVDLDEDKESPYGPFLCLSEEEPRVLRQRIWKHLEKRFIKPSTSESSAPILLVKSSEGGLQPEDAASAKVTQPFPSIQATECLGYTQSGRTQWKKLYPW